MKNIAVYFISLFFLFNNSLFAYSTNPKDFVGELVNDAINKLSKNHNIYPTYCIDKFSI